MNRVIVQMSEPLPFEALGSAELSSCGSSGWFEVDLWFELRRLIAMIESLLEVEELVFGSGCRLRFIDGSPCV